ncbi:uncharacterized protein LOC123722310 [Papilio machaon]|uniref:uncharacterized protein LOC123722310 n=1 Tax=Papilio machaon TaxID=76193 RepID=UPI001E662E8E|nr:uncharacterized protein LOC123722310 [Papilio machaon]
MRHDNSEQDNSALSCSSPQRNNNIVKLPTIQLPKFSGSYNNWLEFRDTFCSLIHSNDSIDNINKFHYLRASLEGTAAVVIQSIEFSAGNYLIAWNLLCDRFDNKRLLIQNHVAAIFNIETITKESNYILKRTIDTINKNIRALESLGEPVSYWDTLLIYIISHKLDSKTYREWEEYKDLKYKPTTNVCSNTEDRSALSPANPTQGSDEPSGNVTLSAQLSTYLPNRTQQKVEWHL